ncbi:hypothetical protein [Salinigranum sp. GCM10025319]|uniref:hypothetical protein n=1 Tax=Salinigranum sp. GCM10025319 TaxID=3252687 RepID=UPI00361CDD73
MSPSTATTRSAVDGAVPNHSRRRSRTPGKTTTYRSPSTTAVPSSTVVSAPRAAYSAATNAATSARDRRRSTAASVGRGVIVGR